LPTYCDTVLILFHFHNAVVVTLGEPQTEEEQHAVLQYEEWLRQNDMWLATNIQSLEQQVAKYRRTKKALNAKQRVVCIIGVSGKKLIDYKIFCSNNVL